MPNDIDKMASQTVFPGFNDSFDSFKRALKSEAGKVLGFMADTMEYDIARKVFTFYAIETLEVDGFVGKFEVHFDLDPALPIVPQLRSIESEVDRFERVCNKGADIE